MAEAKLTLVLGGARSGKSRFSEDIVLHSAGSPVYIATATAYDQEMRDRIHKHKSDRAEGGWKTVEEPLDLAAAISANAQPGNAILVDCLTLWLSNLMMDGRDIDPEFDRLIDCLKTVSCPVVCVSNEVGMGIVPENALARAFRDHTGRLHQLIAAEAENVVMMVAGLPLSAKGKL